MSRVFGIILTLSPRSFREDFASEILDVIRLAGHDAKRQGWLTYAVFCVKELAGLLWLTAKLLLRRYYMRYKRGILLSGVAGLVAATVIAYSVPYRYTSRASIRVTPAMISDRFVPAHDRISTESVVLRSSWLLSRASLKAIIEKYELYPEKSRRKPIEEVIEHMSGDIRFVQLSSDALEIAFAYHDPLQAQKVTRELMTRIIDDHLRFRFAQVNQTVAFLEQQTEDAAANWSKQVNTMTNAGSTGAAAGRRMLDSELARKEYESLKGKLAEARIVQALENNRQGPTLEVLDLPSVREPARPLDRAWIVAAGLAIGLFAGFVATWLRRPGPPFEQPAPSPNSAT